MDKVLFKHGTMTAIKGQKMNLLEDELKSVTSTASSDDHLKNWLDWSLLSSMKSGLNVKTR